MGWIPANFDHTNYVDNCFSCHNGTDATGKNPTHIQTSNVCEDCHNNVTFVPADRVDHTQVLGACGSCHDGSTATGKHPTHIASGNNCDDCHTTVAWLPANFDHVNITGNCFSCHNGTDAAGKHPMHASTTNTCEACHSTVAFSPVATMDHSQVIGSCSSCHNGSIATGKNAGHFVTAQECDLCHTSNRWTPHIYRHSGLPYEPLDHQGNLACTECHQGNTETVNWRSPAFQPDCAGCHANDFKRKDKHIGGENGTVSQNRDCSGGGQGCHRITDREF
jgi:hypothetical protein